MIDYTSILAAANSSSVQEMVGHLQSELLNAWLQDYIAASGRPTNVLQFQHGTFNYVYDYYTKLESTGAVLVDPTAESRLVAVYGTSAPKVGGRDDSRLRGWVGRTEATFGLGWDKGHFIANSIGGNVDGLEANVFLQRRDINRGWGPDGKRYRRIEKYCCKHAGVFCFSRPIYADASSRPSAIEFGVLRDVGVLWVERFSNVYAASAQ